MGSRVDEVLSFQGSLGIGRAGENTIARYLACKWGYIIVPFYGTEGEDHKGPRIMCAKGELVAPDLLCLTPAGFVWAECKHKDVFTWFRKSRTWQTGIDRSQYEHYKLVREVTRCRVYIFFLHKSSEPDEGDRSRHCPAMCPTGLFGGEIRDLVGCEDHQDDRWGNTGMVYWKHESLRCYAPLSAVLATSEAYRPRRARYG